MFAQIEFYLQKLHSLFLLFSGLTFFAHVRPIVFFLVLIILGKRYNLYHVSNFTDSSFPTFLLGQNIHPNMYFSNAFILYSFI